MSELKSPGLLNIVRQDGVDMKYQGCWRDGRLMEKVDLGLPSRGTGMRLGGSQQTEHNKQRPGGGT